MLKGFAARPPWDPQAAAVSIGPGGPIVAGRRPAPPLGDDSANDPGIPHAVDPMTYAEGPDDPAVAASRARAALAALAEDLPLDDGLVASILLANPDRLQGPVGAALLADLTRRMDSVAALTGPFGWHRPPTGSPAFARAGRPRISWRPGEARLLAREPTEYLERLRDPLAIVDTLELLARLEVDGDAAVAATARRIRVEAMPLIETEMAWWILGSDPWRDTFALWVATDRPHVPPLVHALLVATATRYATIASRVAGVVCGNAAPFSGRPLVSASAHLVLGLWTLGLYPSLVPGIVAFVAENRGLNGAWADPGQPSDVLTTLAGAEVMSRLVPDFDPGPTARYLARLQERGGWWRALDPEVPWLTSAVLAWLERAGRPYHERFAWPAVQKWDRDRKTRIPTYTYFSDMARVLGAVPGLREASMPILFCDLAGFKEFNNAKGQQLGDEVLRVFAAALGDLASARAIRDGGDEFVVLGAPGRPAFVDDVQAFRRAWPRLFADAFGKDVPAVAPRLLVSAATGGTLEACRERLGRLVGEVKAANPEPGAEGVLVEIT
jgi:GGDEF domain-containing protein